MGHCRMPPVLKYEAARQVIQPDHAVVVARNFLKKPIQTRFRFLPSLWAATE